MATIQASFANAAEFFNSLLDESFIGNIEKITAGLAMNRVPVVSLQAALGAVEANLRGVKEHSGKI
jgi:hypothetical protein